MRKGACKHFTGIQKKRCRLDVEYQSLPKAPVQGINLPCLVACGKDHCEKWEEPTKEEIEKNEAIIKEAMDQMMRATPWINVMKLRYPTGTAGYLNERCPICSGVIHFGIAGYNGHMRAQCETENCVNFIE